MKIREGEGEFPHRKERDESGRISNEEYQRCHVHGQIDEATGPGNWCRMVCCEKKTKIRKEKCWKIFHTVPLQLYVVGSKSFRPDIQKPRQMKKAMSDI